MHDCPYCALELEEPIIGDENITCPTCLRIFQLEWEESVDDDGEESLYWWLGEEVIDAP